MALCHWKILSLMLTLTDFRELDIHYYVDQYRSNDGLRRLANACRGHHSVIIVLHHNLSEEKIIQPPPLFPLVQYLPT